MTNKCAKFHKDSPSGKKLNSISRERLNFRRRPVLCTTLYRNLMQASNFGGSFDQLFLWIVSWNFHRRCLSTFSIPWCKKVISPSTSSVTKRPLPQLWNKRTSIYGQESCSGTCGWNTELLFRVADSDSPMLDNELWFTLAPAGKFLTNRIRCILCSNDPGSLQLTLVGILSIYFSFFLSRGSVRVHVRQSSPKIATQPVILWTELGDKPKWLPLNFNSMTQCAQAPFVIGVDGSRIEQVRKCLPWIWIFLNLLYLRISQQGRTLIEGVSIERL